MSVVCPTVLATSEEDYKIQMDRVSAFAKRIQIDLMDGDFAKPESVGMDKVWWPKNLTADIHVMYRKPMDYLDKLIELKPNLVIIHAEADVEHAIFAKKLHEADIKAGLCLLAPTQVSQVKDIINEFDHFLVFAGILGSFGATADLSVIDKIAQAKELNSSLEIGWDGGINDKIAKQLASAGVDVLNTGSFIQKAQEPKVAYEYLSSLL